MAKRTRELALVTEHGRCQALIPPYPGVQHQTQCPQMGEVQLLRLPDVRLVVWLCQEHGDAVREMGGDRDCS